METWKLCFVLVLPLTVCLNNKEILVKTITSEPDVTQICSNSTSDIITLIVCKIRTEKREECRLLYQYGWDFEHQCDFRFRLMMKDHFVILHLTNLTRVDSGIYTCECSKLSGTYILNLNVTVEVSEDEESSSSTQMMLIHLAWIGAPMVIIITGVTLRFICKTKMRRESSRSRSACETQDQEDPDDSYLSIYPECDVYQTVSYSASKIMTVPLEITGKESVLYENI